MARPKKYTEEVLATMPPIRSKYIKIKQRYAEKKKDEIADYQAEYYLTHKKERQKKYKENKEEILKKKAERDAKRKKEISLYNKKYYNDKKKRKNTN